MARTMMGTLTVLSLAITSTVNAQTPARSDPERLQAPAQQFQIDPSRLQVREQQLAQSQTTQQFPDPGGYEARANAGPWIGWVNFNRGSEPAVSAGSDITRAYENIAGGIRFGLGERVAPEILLCRDGSRECAGGAPSGGHVLRDTDGVLRIDFAQPIVAITMAAAADWSQDGRAEVFQIEGWGNGDILMQTQQALPREYVVGENWVQLTLNGQQRQTATAGVAATGAPAGTEFDYVLIRALNANGGPVNAPILIDDLRFADDRGSTPLDNEGPRAGGLDDMLEDTGRIGPGLQRNAEVVRQGGQSADTLYPVAQRIRMVIDYEAARAGAERQRANLNLDISIPTLLGRAEDVSVPVLAPLGAFEGENPRGELAEGVAFMGRPDFYHLILPTELGEAVITGTRLATPSRHGQDRLGTLEIGRGYAGARSSFNLYGASYSVRLSCEGSDIFDEPCNDTLLLESLLERLFLFIPPEEDWR